MARSLTIQPEEQASRSSLLTGFLIFAVAWLAVGAMAAAVGDTTDDVSGAASAAP